LLLRAERGSRWLIVFLVGQDGEASDVGGTFQIARLVPLALAQVLGPAFRALCKIM
jgi:hypothetical protein